MQHRGSGSFRPVVAKPAQAQASSRQTHLLLALAGVVVLWLLSGDHSDAPEARSSVGEQAEALGVERAATLEALAEQVARYRPLTVSVADQEALERLGHRLGLPGSAHEVAETPEQRYSHVASPRHSRDTVRPTRQ